MTIDRAGASILDPQVLRELEGLGADLGEDVLGDVIGAFQKTAPQLVDELVQAAQVPDLAAVARAAHTLRSAALQVGATGLTELARCVESEALGGCDVRARAEACAQALAEVGLELSKLAGKSA